MCLTQPPFHEKIRLAWGGSLRIRFHRLQIKKRRAHQQQRIACFATDIGVREEKRLEQVVMHNLKEKIRFTLSAALYLLFNLRIGADLAATLQATGWQILQTAPFVAGLTYLIVSVLQYMGDGGKVPWDRKLRLFFAIGIIAGLILAIWEYAGVDLQQ